jgi:hypothetical protein
MSKEKTYIGESEEGSLQEALNRALQKLDAAIGEDGARDASASWTLAEISGLQSGLAGFTKLKVRLVTKRTPDWPSGS